MVGATQPTTDRLDRARGALEAAGIDGLLLTPGPDLQYLTGLGDIHAGERLAALVLGRSGQALWICPAMNRPQVEACAGGVSDIRSWTDATGYTGLLSDAARELGLAGRTVAVDEEMRAAFLLDLQATCPSARTVGASRVMRTLRLRKDVEELRLLHAAGALADRVIPRARAACRPGRAENDVADEIRSALSEAAPGFRPAFCIVASGPNGALPHHETGSRRLAAGELVVLDYGGHLEGYVCDITITHSLGHPADEEAARVYRTVWEAQQRALEVIRPGVPCGAVDRAARAQIEAAGYGPYFLHRTGHGVGLQIHEPPYLVPGSEEPLEEGMCFSVEPGIYLPARFGARLEVLVTVTSDGVELLNEPSSPELIAV
jgi:D-alanyl-D-alanine dipeptidase